MCLLAISAILRREAREGSQRRRGEARGGGVGSGHQSPELLVRGESGCGGAGEMGRAADRREEGLTGG
jgi:hypothetical protein